MDAARGCPGLAAKLRLASLSIWAFPSISCRKHGGSVGSRLGLRAIEAVGGDGAPTERLAVSASSIPADLVPRVGQLEFANAIDVVSQ